jgi:hypothetical protein
MDRARELAAELRTTLAQPPAPAAPAAARGGPNPTEVARYRAAQRAEAAQLMQLIDAYELLRGGDARSAFTQLMSGQIVAHAATLDLLDEIASSPDFAASGGNLREAIERFRADERARRIEAIQLGQFAEMLPPLEQIGGGNRFRGQGWGANGYDDRETEEGVTIEFSGGSTITTTEELALLRAAQLARENGFSGFVVRTRSDFQRYRVTTYAGAETSRSPAGFETRMEVGYVDAAAPPAEWAGSVVNAEEVWTALSPIFNPPRSRR